MRNLKIELWKVAQWGHVSDEKTLTVTLALALPMLKILLSAVVEIRKINRVVFINLLFRRVVVMAN